MLSGKLDEAILFLIGGELRGTKLVSKGCLKSLKAIFDLFGNRDLLKHFYSNDTEMNVGFLITLTHLLAEHSSLTAVAAQSEVFQRYFLGLIPAKLKGFEIVWMHTFEYHRSIENESREICCLVCNIVSQLLEYKAYRKRNGLSTFSYPIAQYLEQSPLSGDFLCRILGALDRYPCHSDVTHRATNALIYLILALDDNGDMGVVFGAVRSITTSLDLHLDDANLMDLIFDTLRKVKEIPANICKHLIYPSFCVEKIFVRILHRHQDNTNLCTNVLLLIEGLLEEKDCSIQDRFMECNVVKYVIMLLNSRPHDSVIACAGCTILLLLAERNAEYKRILGQNGACEAVMIALSHHNQAFRLCGLSRPLIRSLAYNSVENKHKLLQLGASDWVPQLNVSGWLDGSESEQGGDY